MAPLAASTITWVSDTAAWDILEADYRIPSPKPSATICIAVVIGIGPKPFGTTFREELDGPDQGKREGGPQPLPNRDRQQQAGCDRRHLLAGR